MSDMIDVAPVMTGVPAAISEAEGALSTFPDGFAGIMVGAQHVPGFPPAIVVGVLKGTGEFVAGMTSLEFARRLRELLDLSIEAIERGDFDQAERAQ